MANYLQQSTASNDFRSKKKSTGDVKGTFENAHRRRHRKMMKFERSTKVMSDINEFCGNKATRERQKETEREYANDVEMNGDRDNGNSRLERCDD